MTIPFNTKNQISDPADLFGFNGIFEQLIATAKSKSNAQLIGVRRSGKTSLFKCLTSFFRNNPDLKVFPIYFDFKEVATAIKGTANVYRYCIALTVSELIKANLLKGSVDLVFREQIIKQSDLWENVFASTQTIGDMRIYCIFEDMITHFACQMQKTFLFLFDEYEHLFRHSFDSPTGFMKFRNVSSKIEDGHNPFMFFVAGSISWEGLCSITGSGELNCIDRNIYVKPIDYSAFTAMWLHEVGLAQNCPEEVKAGFDFAYQKIGGIPFYGKMIGSAWLISKNRPTSLTIKPHLKELYETFTDQQKKMLVAITRGATDTIRETPEFCDLIEKGIINKKHEQYSISIGFLRDFLESVDPLEPSKEPNSLKKIAMAIEELVININNTNHNKHGKYVFIVGNEDAIHYQALSKDCIDRDSCSRFASALYILFWDRTHISQPEGKSYYHLPAKYVNNTDFIKLIQTFRHTMSGHHMGSYTPKDNQISKAEMLEKVTGSKNEPRKPECFQRLQIKFLELCKNELEQLLEIVEAS